MASFLAWCHLCATVKGESAQTRKTACIRDFLNTYKADALPTLQFLLIRQSDKRQFRLGARKMLRVVAEHFERDPQTLQVDFARSGDAADTIRRAFRKYADALPKATLALREVNTRILTPLSQGGTLAHQRNIFATLFRLCEPDEVYWVIKLIEKDLRLGAGPKVILNALQPQAYAQWKVCNDLARVVNGNHGQEDTGTSGVQPMAPVEPMLCRVTKSYDDALTRCSNGFYAEVKYDGERVQIHKQQQKLAFYSRKLKAVTPYKVDPLRPYLQQALKHVNSVVLDAEVVMMDTVTHQPLPFGTLGKYKRRAHTQAVPCLLVFDVLYADGESLLNKALPVRRAKLEQIVKVIPNRVQRSELVHVKANDRTELDRVFQLALKHKLEGLVLKDVALPYEPGARHWLKLKRDHLQGMADTADLVVLGSIMGKGRQSGLHATFLMGCYDAKEKVWKTVCKVGNGFTDDELAAFQNILVPHLTMVHRKRASMPTWLRVHTSHLPDAVVTDPWQAPVLEIAGAEFTASSSATSGWALRFPRIVRERDDKAAKQATNHAELDTLATLSTAPSDIPYPGLSK